MRTVDLLDVQPGFRKGRGIRDQVANICLVTEKARIFFKASTFALLTTLKTSTSAHCLYESL